MAESTIGGKWGVNLTEHGRESLKSYFVVIGVAKRNYFSTIIAFTESNPAIISWWKNTRKAAVKTIWGICQMKLIGSSLSWTPIVQVL